jgi:hypothetical protein
MLTRVKLKLGKGELESYNSDIERRLCKHNMTSEGREGEYPSMNPKEVMATLHSMREIIDDFQ